jgi:hypothetical protein
MQGYHAAKPEPSGHHQAPSGTTSRRPPVPPNSLTAGNEYAGIEHAGLPVNPGSLHRHSTRQKPARCSLVSAYGPSVVLTAPRRTRTVVVLRQATTPPGPASNTTESNTKGYRYVLFTLQTCFDARSPLPAVHCIRSEPSRCCNDDSRRYRLFLRSSCSIAQVAQWACMLVRRRPYSSAARPKKSSPPVQSCDWWICS